MIAVLSRSHSVRSAWIGSRRGGTSSQPELRQWFFGIRSNASVFQISSMIRSVCFSRSKPGLSDSPSISCTNSSSVRWLSRPTQRPTPPATARLGYQGHDHPPPSPARPPALRAPGSSALQFLHREQGRGSAAGGLCLVLTPSGGSPPGYRPRIFFISLPPSSKNRHS